MGEADITTVSHIGRAFIGEGEVHYQGKTVSAMEAMEAEGLKPLRLTLKDAHTIILTNSQGEAMTACLVREAEELVKEVTVYNAGKNIATEDGTGYVEATVLVRLGQEAEE